MAGYKPPRVVEYGDLRELTAADFGFLVAGPEGGSALGDISPVPLPPPEVPPEIPPDIIPPGVGQPDIDIEVPPGAPPEIAQVPGPAAGAPGAGAPGAGAPGAGAPGAGAPGAGGELPITGFPAALVGSIGSGLAALGLALRKIAGRE